MHSDLVKWIVKLLLKMTSTDMQGADEEEGEEEKEEEEGEGEGPKKREGPRKREDHSHIRHIESTANLKADFSALSQVLANFNQQLLK